MSEAPTSPPPAGGPASASVMNRIVATALRQPLLVLLMTAVLIGVGVWSLQRLPVDAYPDLSPPMVEVITQWPGHAAEEVERLITVPTEIGLTGIPRTVATRSISRPVSRVPSLKARKPARASVIMLSASHAREFSLLRFQASSFGLRSSSMVFVVQSGKV